MSLEDDDDQDRGELLEPLEDLDDEEFGLPPVENLPTLEEILAENEDDDQIRTVDDFDDDATSYVGLGFNDGLQVAALSAALHHLGIEG